MTAAELRSFIKDAWLPVTDLPADGERIAVKFLKKDHLYTQTIYNAKQGFATFPDAQGWIPIL